MADPHSRKHHYAQGLVHSPIRGLIRKIMRSQGGGFGAALITYLLNALGIATKGVQTASLPTESLAPDYTGTLVDYGGAVNSESVDVAAVPGSRLATTVAEGAVLGAELFSDFGDINEWSYSQIGTGTVDMSTDGLSFSAVVLAALDRAFCYYRGAINNGDTFKVSGTHTVNSGVPTKGSVSTGVAEAVTYTTTTEFDETLVVTGGYLRIGIGTITGATEAANVTISNISVRKYIPTIQDTDASGNDLHPYTLVNGVKNYTFHPAHKVSTLYSAGDKVFAEASDGVWHYYSASAGATGATAPTFPTTGTVVDGTVTWTEEGLYTLRGQRVEGSATNVVFQSRDLDTTWYQRGSVSAVQDLVGADGNADTGWTLSGLDTASVGDLYTFTHDLPVSSAYATTLLVRQIDTSGVLVVGSPLSLSFGEWHVDLSKLSTDWEILDYNHAAVTVIAPFITNLSGSIGIHIFKYSGTGTLSVGYYNSQLESGEISTSQIETTTAAVTRQAVNISVDIADTDLTASSGAGRLILTPTATGQTGTLLSSYTDASNYTSVEATPTTITLNKMVGGTKLQAKYLYTHAKDQQFVVDFKWDTEDGMELNVFEIGETPGDTVGVAMTNIDAVLSSTLQIGGKNDTDHFNATYESYMTFASEEKALAQYDDFSLESAWMDAMILTFNVATDGETITVPTQAIGTFNATVDWGDGSTSTVTAPNDPNLAHVYATAGSYDVKITGTFPNIYFANVGDISKLTAIKSLGKTGLTTLSGAFWGGSNAEYAGMRGCDTSSVTSMRLAMSVWSSIALPPDFSSFDTSKVIDMYAAMYSWVSMTENVAISNLEVGAVTIGTHFIGNITAAGLTTAEYDKWLINAYNQSATGGGSGVQSTVTWDFSTVNTKYTLGGAAEAARSSLIANDLWVINDAGGI